MDKSFETEIMGLGNNITGYPGAFTPVVDALIRSIIDGNKSVLHLFSGVSRLGTERIDMTCDNATRNCDVMEFIGSDSHYWDFVILDPPYEIHRKSLIEEYSRASSVAADVRLRRALADYFQDHVDNIIWLDMCAPMIRGFRRKKLWFLMPGGYHTVRVLSWLEKYTERLI